MSFKPLGGKSLGNHIRPSAHEKRSSTLLTFIAITAISLCILGFLSLSVAVIVAATSAQPVMMEANASSVTDEMSDDSCSDVLTQLKDDRNRSSAHSTAPLSDSITASEFEYGNDSKTENINLNESLSTFDAMLQARGNGGRTQRLNSSFGSLTKTTSFREIDGPKPKHARRRSSVHGYTPSDTYEMSPCFHTEFKASVDDWNSELPLDSDDEITASYSQLNSSVKSVKSPKKSEKVKASTVEKVENSDAEQQRFEDSMKSPSSGKARKLRKAKSSSADISNVGVASSSKSKDRKSKTEKFSLCKLESRFVQSVRIIRGGMSFRSTDSSKSGNTSLSKSDHFHHKNNNSKSVLVEGTSTEL